jgi:tryptophan synthase alpha chain
VDGLILPDVPPEEIAPLRKSAIDNGLNSVLLIAPNTSDRRMNQIDDLASGFVYAVSVTGLTGSALEMLDPIGVYLQRARRNVRKNPLLVGFGIRSYEDATRLSEHTDGFIVGSALIQAVGAVWDQEELDLDQRLAAVSVFVRSLKMGPTQDDK